MTPLEELDLSNLRVIDGAMATELERRGCDISGPLWSARVLAQSPETIIAVHEDYLAAGADCLLTASYQVSPLAYADAGLSAAAADHALRDAVRLTEVARDRHTEQSLRRVWIGVSLGPYGAALHNGAEYHGNYTCTPAELVAFHSHRLEVLASTAADFAAFETVPSLAEAEAIVAALHNHPGVGAWLSFTCSDDRHVAHGELLADCASLLAPERQILAVGINCTAPRWVSSLIGELRRASSKPIVVYPNSGELWDAEHRRWLGSSDPADFGSLAAAWSTAGAQAVGGCCRTGPEHIRTLRQALDSATVSGVGASTSETKH